MLTHVDLFSGIGGFSLACQWAGVETIAFAEIDPYACRVLERRFPGVRNYGDVGNVPAIPTWLLTGGVPCQPASIAGQRRGTSDNRWLWPQALAAVERIQPTWVCLENPLGILSLEKPVMSLDLEGYGNLIEAAISSEGDFWAAVTGEVELVFRNLISSVEKLGYEVSPVVIPACGLGAWHRRYRVWIMGHATGVQSRPEQQPAGTDYIGLPSEGNDWDTNTVRRGGNRGPEQEISNQDAITDRVRQAVSDANRARKLQPQGRIGKQWRRTSDGDSTNASDALSEQLRTSGYSQVTGTAGAIESREEKRERIWDDVGQCGEDAADTDGNGREGVSDRSRARRSSDNDAGREIAGSSLPAFTDSCDNTPARFREHGGEVHAESAAGGLGISGGYEWWATEPDVGRVAHGVSSRLDRLRTLGNAIVPQVAFQLIKRMVETEAHNEMSLGITNAENLSPASPLKNET